MRKNNDNIKRNPSFQFTFATQSKSRIKIVFKDKQRYKKFSHMTGRYNI